MIKKISSFFLLISLALSSLFAANLEKFTIDPDHSYVQWHLQHLGFSSQSGKWYAQGLIQIDKDKPANSKVDAQIDIGNMITGIPALDTHLKGKQFFDVKQYPKATFISDKIELIGKDKATIYGTLKLHGISKPLVLNAKFNKSGKNPLTDKMTVGFSATADLKRSDFGMTTLVPDLSDEVSLQIEVEAYQDKG